MTKKAVPVKQKAKASRKPKGIARPSAKPGPKPDMLKLGGRWQDAIKRSLKKKKPPEGWPN